MQESSKMILAKKMALPFSLIIGEAIFLYEWIDEYILEKQGYVLDISDKRLHHEIYLSDARKVAPKKRKTVIRHPIRKKDT